MVLADASAQVTLGLVAGLIGTVGGAVLTAVLTTVKDARSYRRARSDLAEDHWRTEMEHHAHAQDEAIKALEIRLGPDRRR